MTNLDLAKIKYPKGSIFYTATGKVKNPLTVTTLFEAQHLDRQDQIRHLKSKVLKLWNDTYPKDLKDSYKKLKFTNTTFLEEVKEWVTEIEYLVNLPKDILNEGGGVIYCGEEDRWA